MAIASLEKYQLEGGGIKNTVAKAEKEAMENIVDIEFI